MEVVVLGPVGVLPRVARVSSDGSPLDPRMFALLTSAP